MKIKGGWPYIYMYRFLLIFLSGFITAAAAFAQGFSPNDSLLFAAVKGNDLPLTESLLKKGGNVNLQNGEGLSLMHWAAKENFADMLTLLIRKDANMDIISHYGNTPLELAVYTGSDLCAYLLINSGANINSHGSKDGGTPIQYAVIKKQPALFMHLLRKGADLAIQNKAGYTVIHQIADNEAFPEALQTELNSPYNRSKYDNIYGTDFTDPTAILDTLVSRGAAIFKRDTLGYKALHLACKKNNILVIDYLLKNKDNLNDQENSRKETPLICAIRNKHEELALKLIRKGADILLCENDKWTALHYAARDGFRKATLEILKRKPDINAQMNIGWTALHLAAWNKQTEVANLLLLYGATDTLQNKDGQKPSDLARIKGLEELAFQIEKKQVNLVELYFAGVDSLVIEKLKSDTNPDLSITDARKRTLLHAAATHFNGPFIKFLLQNGANANAQDAEGKTPLMDALENTNYKLYVTNLHLLIQKTNLNLADKDGNTVLHIAAGKEDPELLKLFLKNGANPNQPNKNNLTPFEEACGQSKEPDFLKIFVEAGANVNPKRDDHFSPLMLALEHKYYSSSVYLLNKGANINFKTHNQLTPLHIIAAKGFGKILPVILKKGAIINTQTTDSLFSPLYFAAENGNLAMVKILTWYGANLKAKTIEGLTALDIATREGHEDVRQYLSNPSFDAMEMMAYREEDQLSTLINEDRITDIYKKNTKGESLLHLAVLANSKNLAEAFLSKGGNINEQDLSGNTPLLFALKTCNTSFAPWLIKKGANPKQPDQRGETPYGVSVRRNYRDLALQLQKIKADTLIEIKKIPALIFPNVTAGEIFVARYSPDGKTMLSAGKNNLILWDTKTAQRIREFENVSKSISDLAFSPDGKLAVTVEGKRTTINSREIDQDWKHIVLWDLQTCTFLKTIELNDGHFIRSVVFSEDGKKLLIANWLGGIQLYELSSGRMLAQMGHREKDYTGAEWLPANRGIIAARDDRLEWWIPETTELKKIKQFSEKINKVKISRDGKFVVLGYEKGMLLFDLETWKTVREFDCNNEPVYDVAISPDTRYIAANINFFVHNYVRVFKRDSIQPINEYINHKNQVTSLCFSPDGNTLLGSDAKDQILEWTVKNKIENFISGENSKKLALSADQQFLFTGESNRPLCKRSAKDLSLVETFDTIKTSLLRMTLNEASSRCYMVSALGYVLEYNLLKKKFNGRINIKDFEAIQIFPIDDSILILVSRKAEIIYWNLKQGNITKRWGKDDSATIIHAKLSPDKKRIAMGGNRLKMAYLDSSFTTNFENVNYSGLEYISAISFLEDNRSILISKMGVRDSLMIFSLADNKTFRLINNEISHIYHQKTADGNYVVSIGLKYSGNHSFSFIEISTGEIVYKTTTSDDFGLEMVLTNDGNMFISTNKGIYKKVPDFEQVSRIFNLSPSNLSITGISPDAAFVTAKQDSNHYTINLRSFEKEKIILHKNSNLKKINAISASRNVEIYTEQEGIQYWNFKEAKISGKIAGTKYPLSTSVVSSDGRLVITGDFSATVRIKTLANDSLIQLITMDQIPVSLALSKDNKILFTASTNYRELIYEKTKKINNRLTAWSVETGKLLKQLDTFLTPFPAIILLPETNRLISYEQNEGSNISILKIYHLLKDRITTIMRTDGGVNSIAASHNEKNILINLSSGKVVWYDLDSLKETIVDAHEAPVVASAFSPDDRFFYTVAKDNTVKIWDASTAKQVSTIYLASDTTRMVIGPDNYYACSKEIIKDFGWQADNRRFEFDQFDLVYNRPDLAYRSLLLSDTSQLPVYYKAWKKRLEKMNFSEEMLSGEFHVPEINIINRDKLPFKTRVGNVSLQISAGDKKYKVNRMNAWVNGVPLFGTRGLTIQTEPATYLKQSIALHLSQGKNKIEVSVINEKGTESLKETVMVQYNPPEKRKPDLFLVTIGASEYQDSSMNLVYAAKDAKDISKQFSQPTGLYNRVHSFSLLNREVTKVNLFKLKDSLFHSHPDDVVIIFYAGHGLPDNNLDYFLASWNTDFADPAANGIPYEMLENLVDSIPARNKLILLDACFSGEVDKTAEKMEDSEQNKDGKVNFRVAGSTRGINVMQPQRQKEAFEMMKLQFADLRRSTGALVISSAGSGEFAFEGDSWKNGVFTYSLLDGLISGKADVFPANTGITANELSAYLMQRVNGLTQGRQTPTNRREKVEFDFRIW